LSQSTDSTKKGNHLLNEKSPYLLQHAQNPVDWYPWGKEAFEKAKRENKPIFLSIGYSSCHWCHVMEKESFEDNEIAELLNRYFVSIKVDREERPDVDEIYMKAVVAMTGSGGWPLNVFLTPSLDPFYGGTYFPPSPRYGMPSFSNVLRSISQSWRSDRKKIADSASQMKESLKELYDFKKNADSKLDASPISECYEALAGSFDEEYGGFGTAPKFPTPSNLFFLLRYYADKKSSSLSLKMVTKTLNTMMRGGIYDQVGGGFHRYSTDRYWLVPHFEKMLYDNALLISAYSEAFLITKDEGYANVVRETIEWAAQEMKSERGGFYSAIDADSSEGEGSFYSWTLDEFSRALSSNGFRAEELSALTKYFSVTREGNFEGERTILTAKAPGVVEIEIGLSGIEFAELLKRGKKTLLEARAGRPKPSIDDKILTGWNGLMISALSEAHGILKDPRFLEIATDCTNFILTELCKKDTAGEVKLLRRYRAGEAAGEGMLEDYAFLVNGLLDLYEAGFNARYLEEAVTLSKIMISNFFDETGGGFYQTKGTGELIVRPKDAFDGALPSGNSLAALVCLRLAEITTEEIFRKCANDTLLAFWEAVSRQPPSFTQMLVALQFLLGKPKEIVVSGKSEDPDTKALVEVIRSRFLPQSILILADEKTGRLSPLVEGRLPSPGNPSRVFVCSNFSCKLPSKTEIELTQALSE
jgi:uncharacterized protein